MPFVFIEKILDLWVQLMKNEGKNKSVAFVILVSVFSKYILYLCGFMYTQYIYTHILCKQKLLFWM